MNVSLLITNFGKTNLFLNSLETILPQLVAGDEMVVVDDGVYDGMNIVLQDIQKAHLGLLIKYISTGNTDYRSGCKAKNIALKNSSNELCIINDPEVMHVTKCIDQLRNHFAGDDKRIFVNAATMQFCHNMSNPMLPRESLSNQMAPFVAGVMRAELIAIGGWDERFTKWGNDDNDLMGRLGRNGIHHIADNSMIARHQAHKRPPQNMIGDANEGLLYEVDKPIVANQGVEWGMI